MINITLNVSNNKELITMLETLRKEGLINRLSVIEPEVNISKPTQQSAQVNPVQVQSVPVQPVSVQQLVQTQPVINGNTISQQPTQVNPVQPTPTINGNTISAQSIATAIPTTASTYTLEQLSLAAARGLMDTGRQAELIQLLSQFGVQALTQLPKEQYGAFATALRAKGCQI